MPEMAAATLPILPRWAVTRVAGHYTSFDAGRGCPFQCSFCTIINVQGRKSRYRTPDDVEAIVRANAAQGITRFFVTDDNFARNKQLGADPRPPDRAARAGRLQHQAPPAGRHAVPPHSELHRESGARRLHCRVHRPREHQPRIPDGHEEAAEQDLGIPRDAAGLEAGQGDDLRRLYPGLPDRYAGIDRARHRDHQERAADRSVGVLLPDAAAGLGGPQEAAHARGADGPRHEQIRPRARLHRASADGEGDLGAGLCGRVAAATTPTSTWKR